MPRNYSVKTLKALFALSGNKCACPDCYVPVIRKMLDGTVCVIAEIAHIHAVSQVGPRPLVATDPFDTNEFSNLIVLCPTHHTIVDKLPEKHSVALLKSWKERSESKKDLEAVSLLVSQSIAALIVDLFRIFYVLRELADENDRIPKFISIAEQHLIEFKDELNRSIIQLEARKINELKVIERVCQGIIFGIKTRQDVSFNIENYFDTLGRACLSAFAFFQINIPTCLNEHTLIVEHARKRMETRPLPSTILGKRLATQQELIDLTQVKTGLPTIAYDAYHVLSIPYFLIDHRLFQENRR